MSGPGLYEKKTCPYCKEEFYPRGRGLICGKPECKSARNKDNYRKYISSENGREHVKKNNQRRRERLQGSGLHEMLIPISEDNRKYLKALDIPVSVYINQVIDRERAGISAEESREKLWCNKCSGTGFIPKNNSCGAHDATDKCPYCNGIG